MKKAMLLLIAATSILSLSAQTFTMGPKVGINYSKLVFDETFQEDGVDFDYITRDAEVGLAAGGFVRLRLGKLILQPEVMFSQDKSKVRLSSIGFDDLQDLKINKIDVPMLVGFEIGEVFRIQGGPVASFVLDANQRSSVGNTWNDFTQNYDRSTWGYQAGIGFDVWRIVFDLRYEGSLKKFGMQYEIGNQTFNFDHRKSALQATVGLKIFK